MHLSNLPIRRSEQLAFAPQTYRFVRALSAVFRPGRGSTPGIHFEQVKYAAALLGVFIAYAAAGKIGLAVPVLSGSPIPFWPPASVSLAAVLLFGYDVWPAIFVADIALSLAHHDPFALAFGIALANTIEPLIGAALLRSVADFKPSLQRLRDVIELVVFGAFAGPIAGTAVYVAFRKVVLHLPIERDFHIWFMWMRSDVFSVLVLAPLLLVWSRGFPNRPTLACLSEAAAAFGLLVVVNRLVFSMPGSGAFHDYAIEHVSFLFIIWLALRFGTYGTTLGVLATALIATRHTLAGTGPFALEGLFSLHVFLGVISVTGLIIAAVISEHRETTSTLRASDQQLRASEERYRDLFENAQDFIVTVDLQGRFTSANNAVLQVSGFSREEFLNKKILDVVAPNSAKVAWSAFTEVLAGSNRGESQLELVSKDGRTIWVEVNSRRLTHDGAVVGIQSIGRDISWRKRMEQELLHSQKMEAVGRLAGGVAHDFNNLLGVIIGYSDLTLQELGDDDPLRKRIGEIRNAGRRAAEVTRQLLAFSRKQVLTPKAVDLSSLVSETTRMLLRLLGEDIELITKLSPIAARVKTDPAQMQQVIMNLALNARDAMPRGGKLILETATVALDQATGSTMVEELTERGISVLPGQYVMVAVSDTGTGMDAQTKARIFEPFFTTKQPGEGTGLGLSTVYGFVKQSGGYIWVYSELGRGTTIKIYMPRIEASAQPIEHGDAPTLPRGSATILLVEDEESLRELNLELMQGLGYTVLLAAYGAQALQIAEEHSGRIDLLLTDVVMPGMSGRELAERLAFTRPEMKVLYMSGYTDNVIVHHGILESGIAFLQKPFTRDELARKLREVLESPSPKNRRG